MKDRFDRLLKPVLYTPETKKITQLLQEFRAKQLHWRRLSMNMENEGIVTIEDILRSSWRISDEYDVGQEALYTALPQGLDCR